MRRFPEIAEGGRVYFLVLLAIITISSCRQPKELIYQDVENFSVKQAGLNKTLLAMDIRLYNPNKYSMKLKSADLNVFLNNNHLGLMNVNEYINFPALDTFALPVTLEVDMKNVLPNLLQIILNSDVDIKVTGALKAGKHGVYLKIPINYEGKQDILSGIKM